MRPNNTDLKVGTSIQINEIKLPGIHTSSLLSEPTNRPSGRAGGSGGCRPPIPRSDPGDPGVAARDFPRGERAGGSGEGGQIAGADRDGVAARVFLFP